MAAKEWVDLAGHIAWPVVTIGLVVFVSIRFKPAVVALINRFETIKIGNLEITVREVKELLEIAQGAKQLAAEQVKEAQEVEQDEAEPEPEAESGEETEPSRDARVGLALKLLNAVNQPGIRDLLIGMVPAPDTRADFYLVNPETGQVELGQVKTYADPVRQARLSSVGRARPANKPDGPDDEPPAPVPAKS